MKRIRNDDINTEQYWNCYYMYNTGSASSVDAYKSLWKLAQPYCQFERGQKNALVDVACGEGSGIYSLRSDNYECWGFDISSLIIEQNQKKYPLAHWRKYDCNKEVFPLRSYDRAIAISMHSMEHVVNAAEHVINTLNFVHKYVVAVPFEDHFRDCPEHVNRFDRQSFGQYQEFCFVHSGVPDSKYTGLEESIVYILKGKR